MTSLALYLTHDASRPAMFSLDLSPPPSTELRFEIAENAWVKLVAALAAALGSCVHFAVAPEPEQSTVLVPSP
jgi:hypothetical protein